MTCHNTVMVESITTNIYNIRANLIFLLQEKRGAATGLLQFY
jgi:hypothetical protein